MLLYGLFSCSQPVAFSRVRLVRDSSSSRLGDSDLRQLLHLLVLYHCGLPDSARNWVAFACKCLFARRDFGFAVGACVRGARHAALAIRCVPAGLRKGRSKAQGDHSCRLTVARAGGADAHTIQAGHEPGSASNSYTVVHPCAFKLNIITLRCAKALHQTNLCKGLPREQGVLGTRDSLARKCIHGQLWRLVLPLSWCRDSLDSGWWMSQAASGIGYSVFFPSNSANGCCSLKRRAFGPDSACQTLLGRRRFQHLDTWPCLEYLL